VFEGNGAGYLAGGTDLMPLLKNGLCRSDSLIDLEKLEDLNGIKKHGDAVFVGAMTDLAHLSQDGAVKEFLPAVALAARKVASPQIRNMATLGGNLLQEKRCIYFNQSEFWRENINPCYRLAGDCCYQIPKAGKCMALYYSDLAPILMAYEATATVFDGLSHEEIPVAELVHSHCRDNFGKRLVEGVSVRHIHDGSIGLFMKYGVRQAIDFALSNVGIRFTPHSEGGTPATLAIVVGAVAPEPVRLAETEREVLTALDDTVLDKDRIYAFALKELQSRCRIIREFTVGLKGKRNALLIVADALRSLFDILGR
jgi:4-hydroxybenzoyl-CoA reductase subunit beta